MKESYGKGLATHTGPESCGAVREDGVEASTGERAGRVFSRESQLLRGADAVRRSGRPHRLRRHRKTQPDPARSETPSTLGYTMCGTGRSWSCPWEMDPRAVSGSREAYADDAR